MHRTAPKGETTMATSIPSAQVDTIIFACEAGIGSSIMGVNALKKKLKQAGVSVNVIHKPVRAVPANAKVVVAFAQFLNDPALDRLVQTLQAGGEIVEVR